jgi:hypothetical protein
MNNRFYTYYKRNCDGIAERMDTDRISVNDEILTHRKKMLKKT